VVLGISTDSSAENKAFRSKFEFPYDLLSDVDMRMSIAYGAAADGAARASRVSVLIAPDRRIAAVYSKVNPAEHADEVLRDLARLG
jgi:thioredoxin-dependent peroxiredoxin